MKNEAHTAEFGWPFSLPLFNACPIKSRGCIHVTAIYSRVPDIVLDRVSGWRALSVLLLPARIAAGLVLCVMIQAGTGTRSNPDRVGTMGSRYKKSTCFVCSATSIHCQFAGLALCAKYGVGCLRHGGQEGHLVPAKKRSGF